LKQIAVRDHFRVENDVHRFRVSGVLFLDLFIRRVFEAPARITGFDALDAFQLLENRFHAPKTSGGKRRRSLSGARHFGRADVFRLGESRLWHKIVEGNRAQSERRGEEKGFEWFHLIVKGSKGGKSS